MLRTLTIHDIHNLIGIARESPRKRKIFRLHEHYEPVQRMVNALIPGTYIMPHKHETPDKVELFSILVGRCAVLRFADNGSIKEVIVLDEKGTNRIVDIAPRTYHSLIPLEPCAVLEIIQGPYDALTHKQMAPWAPAEGTPHADDYRMYLESLVQKWR